MLGVLVRDEPLPNLTEQLFHLYWGLGNDPMVRTRVVLGPSWVGRVMALEPLVKPVPPDPVPDRLRSRILLEDRDGRHRCVPL